MDTICSLTNQVYTTWGARYNSFIWRPEWYTFIRIQNRELKEIEFHKYFKTPTVAHIIYWFDSLILQKIGIDDKKTLDVRIRIVCGLVNKLPSTALTRDLKIQFMDCIWHAYMQFYITWWNWHCKWILQLPF